jgi:eukaryotic-like serine/threonine-protein kinase
MPSTTPPGAASVRDSRQRIGHYEVVAKIGEGGMGEVYRARDTRLNREVALKVLPQTFAADPYRMARFQREAQLLASLNHPKIAAIYGLEESGPTHALVMELVEGPNLAERISKAAHSVRPKAASASPAQASPVAVSGPKTGGQSTSTANAPKSAIPLEEALSISQQLAEALEYAHEHGIIHRDLKPANIKVRPDGCVKVLDFGLAKAMEPPENSADMANSPTLSVAMTQAGFIIGTAAYMAPEQAKGRPVDRRADVWAFGCVLYEMLTGHKVFEGETVSDVLAAVIKSEPDWSALPAETPPPIQRLMRRCLQKDVRQRLQAIGDARIAIEEVVSSGELDGPEVGVSSGGTLEARRASRLRRALPWALGVTSILFAAIAAYFMFQPKPPQGVIRFSVPQPENSELVNGGMMSVSPDGRTIAFVAATGPDKPRRIWLRPLDSVTAQPIPGTEHASWPFWSPDSQQIGFFTTDDQLKKISFSGGPPQTLCEARGWGATWNRDGVILFSNNASLYRLLDTGSTPTLVVAPDPAHQVIAYGFPQFLPDGRHFLVHALAPGNQGMTLGVGSLDSKTVQPLDRINSAFYYAAPGQLLYSDQNTLVARPFDAKALRFTGPAVPIVQRVSLRYGNFAVSSTGVLAYGTGSNHVENARGQMTWFSRSGKKVSTVGQPDVYSNPVISPDGSRLAVSKGEGDKQDIWVYDLKRGTASRLTFNPANDTNPSWSPNGSQILFSSMRNGPYDIYQKAADGLGSTEAVFQSSGQAKAIDDVSPDGNYAIYDTAGNASTTQLWALPLNGDRKPFPVVQSSLGASSAKFSPNGHYVAYASRETGRQEVYVQTFPQRTGKWQISISGGTQPMWRRDGKELFYLAPVDNSPEIKMMSVAVDSGSATLEAGIPKQLFQAQLVPLWVWRNSYAPSPDGEQLLMLVPAGEGNPEPITVVVNWPALLKK